MDNDSTSGQATNQATMHIGGLLATGIIVIIASVFLLLYDSNLMKYGMYHWYALIAYTVIIVVLLSLSAGRRRSVFALLLAFSIIFIVLILVDAAFNLPLSKFYSSGGGMLGFRYLFGFGYGGDNSTFIRSIFLVIDLVASAVLAGLSARALSHSR